MDRAANYRTSKTKGDSLEIKVKITDALNKIRSLREEYDKVTIELENNPDYLTLALYEDTIMQLEQQLRGKKQLLEKYKH